jgi:cbb3-type cytochrome oxidase subunit 1
MDLSVRWFIRTAVLWLLLGLLLGTWMGLEPARVPLLRTSHLHALLPGFVLFMIFGVGYHVLPRFSGRPVPWSRGPHVHLFLANAGVACLVAGFPARLAWPAAGRILLPVGGVLFMSGALLFAHAVWTLTGAPKWQLKTPRGETPAPGASPPSTP